jgi:DNA modification methylase
MDRWVNKILLGSSLEVLRELPDSSIHCCVTSPPYWGLRDYGVEGQLGLEPTMEEYLEKMLVIFREIWRVLRSDGTLWLNLGDSYNGSGPSGGPGKQYTNVGSQGTTLKRVAGLKPKDLVGIPWRVAFALQADGWYLRSDIIWHKPNTMPESVTDRPTKAHEYIFLMSKRERYYYDADAIKEDCLSGPSDIKKMLESLPRIGGKHKILTDPLSKASSLTNIGQKRSVGDPSGRNKRSVWTVATQPFKEAHFATFPPKLIEPCILAGCPDGGIVLDPFMGAGTTAVVCANLGRNYIGIELNPEYIHIANERIKQTTRQARLFP